MFIQTASPTLIHPPSNTQYPVLRTPNLDLRQITTADRADLYELFSHPDVMRFSPLEPVSGFNEVDTMIRDWRDQFQQGTAMQWAVTVNHSSERLIGLCGFSELDCEGRVGRVHYYLHPMYWRHGLMTQALAAVVRYGFGTLNLNRIDCWISLENFAASGLLEVVGFKSEQIVRQGCHWKGGDHDMELYARLRRSIPGH